MMAVWTAAMAAVFEKGSWTRGDTLAAIFCIVGIILVTKPAPLFYHPSEDDEGNVTLGITCALVSAISQGAVNMCIRRIREEDTSVLTLYAMVSESLGSLLSLIPLCDVYGSYIEWSSLRGLPFRQRCGINYLILKSFDLFTFCAINPLYLSMLCSGILYLHGLTGDDL